MLLNPLGLYYSAQEDLSLSQLKKWEFDTGISTEKIQAYCEKYQIWCLVQWDESYSSIINRYAQLPFLLYYQGNLDILNQKILGVVWPRKPSEYWIQVLELFFEKAAHYQLVSLSGFAKWIDQKAHQLSLSHHLPTIAVLGWGFQHYLQGSDRHLLSEIVKNWGLILSEFKLWFTPTKWSFPQRNRLIARLSEMLFLPEAREKSGSLITAEFAYTMKKPVYSVPAPIFAPQSAGIFSKMNEKKLKLITDFDSCLNGHFWLRGKVPVWTSLALSEVQNQLLTFLSQQWDMSLDMLLPHFNLGYQQLLQELTFLEMNKKIDEVWPGIYRKKA